MGGALSENRLIKEETYPKMSRVICIPNLGAKRSQTKQLFPDWETILCLTFSSLLAQKFDILANALSVY